MKTRTYPAPSPDSISAFPLGTITEHRSGAVTSPWTGQHYGIGRYRVAVYGDLVTVENTREGLSRFGPWRYALSRQGMDSAARRALPGVRFIAGTDREYQSSNPTQDKWWRSYRLSNTDQEA